jgi:uncharacterized cofD-like protein
MRQRLRRLARNLKWLLPGMRIKRWILLLGVGLLLATLGLMLLTPLRVPLQIELVVVDSLEAWTGYRVSTLAVDLVFLVSGVLLVLVALRGWFRSIYQAVVPFGSKQLVEVVYEKRQLNQGPRLVAVGGGTGLSTLLRGLKRYTSNLVAVVTVADDGGSSGRLSKELGVLPPGDIRNCLVALADDESLLSDLFQFRFRDGNGLEGHSFGNLFLAVLTEISGDFELAIRRSSQILATRGRVLPSTLKQVTLCARFNDGTLVRGESQIPRRQGFISEVYLEPADCQPPAEVLAAIREADGIVLGPGSLYTSVIPNLLVEGVAQALRQSEAPKIYVCNVMTQPGETDGYTAADHIEAIHRHVKGRLIDYAVVNTEVPIKLQEKYARQGAHPVTPDLPRIQKMDVIPVAARLMSETDHVRHDPARLAETIFDLVARHKADQDVRPEEIAAGGRRSGEP